MTQAQLAGDRYSKSYVSLIESGRAKPSTEVLRFFASRLDRPVEYFRQDQTQQESALRSLFAAAQAFMRRREFAAAEERLRRAASLALNLDDQTYLGRLHDLAAHLFVATGDLSSALMAFREAIAVYQSVEAMDSVAAARCSLANALYLSGDLRSALAEVQLAQDVYAGLEPNHLVLGRSYLLGGNISSASGSHEAARRCYEQALSLMSGRDVLGLGETHAALGFQAARRGEWTEARGALERALSILDGVQDSHMLSIIVRELSEACYQCGDLTHAAEMARRAGGLSASVGDRDGIAWAAVRLAEIALLAGDLATARAAVGEARLLLDNSTPHTGSSQPPVSRADSQAGTEAAQAAAEGRLLLARIHRAQAWLLHQDGDGRSAITHLKAAVDALDTNPPEPGLFVALCRETATRLRELGEVDGAIAYYERALALVEKAQLKDPGGALAPLQLARMPSPLWFRA